MAYANNIGLNQISEFVGIYTVAMETSKSSSKIPKFGFGFKKMVNGSSSSQAKKDTSTVPRSKSMKVPRTQVPIILKRPQPSNSVDHDDDSDDSYHTSEQDHTQGNTLRPNKGNKRNNSKSQPNSRATSPYADSSGSYSSIDSGGQNVGSMTMPTERVSRSTTAPTKGDKPPYQKHTRSSSFSAQERLGVDQTTSTGRPRGYTSVSRLQEPKTVSKAGSPRPSIPIKRTASSDVRRDENESVAKRNESVSRRNERRESTDSGRGVRPSSMISLHEKSPDLNQLASELTQLEESGGFVNDHTHQSGMRLHRPPVRAHTPQSTDNMSMSKLRPPMTSLSGDDRPSSVADHASQPEMRGGRRPRSAADVHRVPPNYRQQTSHGSRSSSPSSGRSTPFGSGKKFDKEKGIEEEIEVDPGHTPRISVGSTGKPTRIERPSINIQPRSRLARSPIRDLDSQSDPTDTGVGLNELEGAILLDADDYRRMVQEVKTLKTMLLRLKRELAADGNAQGGNSAAQPTSMGSSVARLKKGGGAVNNHDLLSKIQKLTSERDKALLDIDKSKKLQKSQEDAMERLKQELQEAQNKNRSLDGQVTELETQREHLLDKMERLHADKHKIEDRLNTLEKSSVYERTVLDMWPEEEEEGTYEESFENGICYDDEEATY